VANDERQARFVELAALHAEIDDDRDDEEEEEDELDADERAEFLRDDEGDAPPAIVVVQSPAPRTEPLLTRARPNGPRATGR
jgi:hypothetical protein